MRLCCGKTLLVCKVLGSPSKAKNRVGDLHEVQRGQKFLGPNPPCVSPAAPDSQLLPPTLTAAPDTTGSEVKLSWEVPSRL